MPTITQLEYILAVDRLRHFSKAAEDLHISQPTLSAQIQKAEEELNLTIFDRNKKPLAPTDKGERFIEQAKVVIREHHKLIESSKADSGELSGHIHLGIIPTLVSSLVPQLVAPLSKNYPRLQIHLDEMKTPDIIRALKNDELDAGILATPLHEEKLKELPLFYEPFYVFCSENHPMASQKIFSEKNLSASDLWLLKEGHCLRTQVLSLCSVQNERTLYPNILFEGGSIESLVELIRNGDGYTLIPELHLRLLTESERKKQVKSLKGSPPCREISLVHRQGDWRKNHFKAIRNTLMAQIPKSLLTKPKPNSEILPITN